MILFIYLSLEFLCPYLYDIKWVQFCCFVLIFVFVGLEIEVRVFGLNYISGPYYLFFKILNHCLFKLLIWAGWACTYNSPASASWSIWKVRFSMHLKVVSSTLHSRNDIHVLALLRLSHSQKCFFLLPNFTAYILEEVGMYFHMLKSPRIHSYESV